MDKSKLLPHEWVAVSLFLGFLLLLILLTQGQSPYLSEPYSSDIEVAIEGAVMHPGAYKLPQGSRMEELLVRGKPDQNADLRRLKLKKVLQDGAKVTVPSYPMITVYLEGAVEAPGALTVRSGTRLCDLEGQIALTIHSDVEKIRKKRKLRDQEIVQIPSILK